jgi:tetratricopeptide (TPR) repeat protein
MPSRGVLFSLLLLICLAHSGFAQTQTSSAAQAGANDYSQQASVIENLSTKIRFENSGSFTREQTTRVRVQTDAGVKQWGLLSFPFQSATQTVEIDYVRVRKPDSSIVVTPPDNVQDLDAEITRSAPFYSDLREKHVAVKSLAPGDVLEYAAHWQSTKALVPGEFWFQYEFQHDAIILHEDLQVRVPAEREIKVKGPLTTQTITSEPGTRAYSWTFSNLKMTKDPKTDQQKEIEAALGRLPPPDVQVSSFQSWDEVAHWYWSLQKERVEPSPAIRAKAAQLTAGLQSEAEKLDAIYKFVSTQYRYIGIAFGIGRYQPHAADDVLTNNYGDCKDKQTLLSSLLQAVGVTVYPALVSSTRRVDPDVPSPAQFDHVIGYYPQGKDATWLDSTLEVAPAGFLLTQLRDKPALVISGESQSKLITTPADPPGSAHQNFRMEATLHDDGSLEGKIEDTMSGENEVLVREAFRRVPQPQWKDLMQQISYSLGFAGTVSDVSASTPEALNEPFHFSYTYNRKEYPDWTNHQFSVPGLPFYMPPLRDDTSYPIWLGSPIDTVSEARVQLPKGYMPIPPADVNLSLDFAEYHATYSVADRVLVAKRRLLIKSHEVPVTEFEQYRNFLRTLQNDVNQYIQTSSGAANTANTTAPDAHASALLGRIRNLPESSSAEANGLEVDARAKLGTKDFAGAISSLYRAVSADPKFARAWVALGTLLLQQKQSDAGIEAFHKAEAAAPDEVAIPKTLGYGLMAQSRFEDAIPVWQELMKAHPDDVDGPANLGNCFARVKRYPEAIIAYQSALKIKPDQPFLQIGLASAYLSEGNRKEAGSAFRKLGQMDGSINYLNDAAYEMANEDLELALALDYAKQAVQGVEEESQKTTLEDLKLEDLGRILRLAAYWDTLGWVDERMSKLPEAEQYLRAGWRLTQDGVMAGHLCHLYERLHERSKAIEMCRLAVSRMSLSTRLRPQGYDAELTEAQGVLERLTGKATENTFDTSGAGIAERTFKLPRFMSGTESAEFFVLMGSDGKSKKFAPLDTKFISGSEKMRMQGKQLRNIEFNVPAPSDTAARFVWRGILGCYQYTGCSFVVLDPDSVHSLN